MAVGGIFQTWRISEEGSRIVFWNMDPSPFVRNSFLGHVRWYDDDVVIRARYQSNIDAKISSCAEYQGSA